MNTSRFGFKRRLQIGALSAITLAMLTACGGGTANDEPPASQTGHMRIKLTDGSDPTLSHVWITVTQIAVHASASADMSDAGWIINTLPAPVTVDVNDLINGKLSQAITDMNLPVGTYKQIRIVLAGADDALTSSASAAGLVYNDQVHSVDDAGNAQVAPLEIAMPVQGMQLLGTFNVTAGSTLDLAVEFDVGHDVVPFYSARTTAYTFTPSLRYFDLAQSGAIAGKVDMSACNALAVNPCGNVIVKAEALSGDGSRYVTRRWTRVADDGSFMLYPLPAAASQTYDVVVRGRNAQSMVVQNVPVTVGATPSNPTAMAAAPLALATAPTFHVNWATGANPTGSVAQFYQTLGSAKPYEMRIRRMDPFSGTFLDSDPLSGGDVQVGAYAAGANPAFAAVTPTEGSGTYSAYLTGWGLARASAGAVTGAADALTLIPAPAESADTSFVPTLGSISGNLVQSTAGKYDSGYLVVTRGGAIVNTVDIASVLAANGGAGGTYTIDHLPAGSAAMPIGRSGYGAGIYSAYLRVWNASTPDAVATVPVTGFANLDATSTATLNVTIP